MNELVTTNFGSVHLERDLVPRVAVRLLSRRGGTEAVYQADVQWSHHLSKSWMASVGFQRSQRHITFEEHAVIDWNGYVGL